MANPRNKERKALLEEYKRIDEEIQEIRRLMIGWLRKRDSDEACKAMIPIFDKLLIRGKILIEIGKKSSEWVDVNELEKLSEKLEDAYKSAIETLDQLDSSNEIESTRKVSVKEAYSRLRLFLRRLDEVREMIKHVLRFGTKNRLNIKLANALANVGLDKNWALATVALQLQEASIKIFAKKLGIKLDKQSIEKILGKKLEKGKEPPFDDKYEAFARVIEEKYKVRMPLLVAEFRKTRAKVLHAGELPTEEDVKSLVTFVSSLTDKLKQLLEQDVS